MTILFVMFFLVLATTSMCQPAVTRQFASELRKSVSWQVVDYETSIFRSWTVDDVKSLLGTALPSHPQSPAPAADDPSTLDLPTSFDFRDRWPVCVHPVRSQGNCGSCWAFAATGQLSDRFCIRQKDRVLSPQYMIECDREDACCSGGDLELAYKFLQSSGTVED